jgi:hypothetical protein
MPMTMNESRGLNVNITARELAGSRRFQLACILVSSLLYGCVQPQPGVEGSGSAALTSDHVVPTGQACTPTGKHFEHRNFACTVCHQCTGTMSFDPAVAGSAATFDAVTKSCSSVSCHTVPSGTFTYTSWDYSIDAPVAVTVPYGGSAPGVANWYATGAANCTVCHGYPPTYQGTAYYWHSGQHGLGIPTGNACQLCHPDATGAYVTGGPPDYSSTSGGLVASCAPGTYCSAPGAITNGTLHANGTLNVTPAWTSSCNGCH